METFHAIDCNRFLYFPSMLILRQQTWKMFPLMLFQVAFSTYYDIKMGLMENRKGIPFVFHFLKEIKNIHFPCLTRKKLNYPESDQPSSFLLLKGQYTPLHFFQVKKYNCLLRRLHKKRRLVMKNNEIGGNTRKNS